LKRSTLFRILGYANEKEAQEASGVKQATWYNVMRIAEAFPNVDEKLFIAMKLTNAEAAMDLPESKRFTEYWLRRAATDSIDDFQVAVDKELDGHAKASTGRERVVSISIKAPASRKKFVDAGLKEYAKEVGCEGDESKALEIMVAENRGSVSLVGTISRAIEKIAAIKKYGNSGVSAAEALEKAYTDLDGIVSEFRAALESLQNLENEG
jgi:hypothetical protein